ncbi:MAG: flagellar export protein FliJ [Desulfuromonadaceae bacterium]|nr:flagellar export protein FliJ [Desulfuromonadaceae bacterium]
MKPFKLQVVLDYRQRLEDQACLRYSQAQQQYDLLVLEQQEAQRLSEQLQQEYQVKQQQGMLGHEFLLYENRIHAQREQGQKLRYALKKAQDQVERCREELADASRNKKLLEKLKEKKQHEALLEELRKEMIHIDEMAIMFRNGDES